MVVVVRWRRGGGDDMGRQRGGVVVVRARLGWCVVRGAGEGGGGGVGTSEGAVGVVRGAGGGGGGDINTWKEGIMLGNGVIGILSESTNKWERRPSTKRIHHDALYRDVGCDISDALSECDLILGIKQPKILAERASLFDYELIVGDQGKRLLAFGKFAGRAGLVDFLSGLGRSKYL
ncbi:hypothetical protein Tco_1426713 [Tanacetum coccineum]